MRRFLSLFTVLMLCGVFAFAQSRVVSGKVTDENGNAVAFASVKIKGSKGGVSADGNGAYTIKVKDGDVLEISGAGFKARDVNIGTLTFVNTSLEKAASNVIAEVVITSAFNTKRTQRSVGANAQNVGAEQLNTIRQPNVNNALAGKVAGAQVRSQSAAALGRETLVRLRGENGIGIGGGALYVVDGTIMPSANDIPVDDVEDVTVLQGPAATALFGTDGANGAIVINTKRAKRSQRNLGIEINSGVTFDKVYVLPNYQNAYAGGNGVAGAQLKRFNYVPGFHPAGWAALDGKYYPDYEDDESWGPRMVGQEYIPWYAWYPGTEYSYKTAKLTPHPNNAREYFNTGVTKQNNIALSKSGDNFSFRASYTNLDQKGIIPSSYLKRNTFVFNGSIDLSTKLTFAANINYLNQKTNTENDDGYANNTTGSFNNWFHRDLDMNIIREFANYKTPDGIMATWNHANPDKWDPARPVAFYGTYYWFNPYSWQNNVYNANNRDRLWGDVSLSYKVNSDLRLKATYRKQQLTTNSETWQTRNLQNSVSSNLGGFNYWETLSGRSATWDGYALGYSTSNRQNYEFLATYNKKIKDFQVDGNAGVDILTTSLRQFNANTMGGLVIPNLNLLSNSKNNINQTNTVQNFKRRALFVRASVGYKNYLFLEGTYRADFLSTEVYENNPINTKSISGSFVFSDLIKDKVPFLTYGKLRASIGQVLSPLGIYQNTSLYTINAQQWNGNFLMTELDRLIDPSLHGVQNDEKEIGIDLRFLKNRLTVSATYWDRTNKDFPFNVSIYGGSGYSTYATNAGEVKKSGVELQASVIPVRNKNLNWTINATWGRQLKNDVVSIAPGIDRVVLQSGQAGTSAYLVSDVGQRWGQLRGIGFKRINGQPVLDPVSHFFVEEPEVNFGSSLPDYTGGVQNSFTVFNNFMINVNIDYSFGGKFFSTSQWYGTGTGLLATTAVLNDKGNSIRDKVADGGGVHAFGVDPTGKPVDYYVEARDYFQQFSYGAGIAEPYIRDLTFVKLRELSLGYKIPTEKLSVGRYLKTAVFSVLVRNPWLIYSKSEGFDPSEISTESGEEGQLPGTRGIGVNLKLGF